MIQWSLTIAAFVTLGLIVAGFRAFKVGKVNFDGPDIPNTTRVALAVTNRLPARDLEIVILRRTTTKPHDVILVRPSALDGDLMAQAVQTLATTRRQFGRVPTHDMLVRSNRLA